MTPKLPSGASGFALWSEITWWVGGLVGGLVRGLVGWLSLQANLLAYKANSPTDFATLAWCPHQHTSPRLRGTHTNTPRHACVAPTPTHLATLAWHPDEPTNPPSTEEGLVGLPLPKHGAMPHVPVAVTDSFLFPPTPDCPTG
ncbi:MAG: hypothetical protein ACPGWR_19095 [Ardenticatenaceae bacterium]